MGKLSLTTSVNIDFLIGINTMDTLVRNYMIIVISLHMCGSSHEDIRPHVNRR